MQDSEETFKVKKSLSKKSLYNKDRDALDKGLEPLTITSRATVGNNASYSKEAMDELRRATQSKTPSTHTSDDFLEEKFPTLLGGNRIEVWQRCCTVAKHITSVLIKFGLSNVLLGPATIIPDANQIHLAKKKREQMRLRNDRDEEEFISLAGGDDTEVCTTFNFSLEFLTRRLIAQRESVLTGYPVELGLF